MSCKKTRAVLDAGEISVAETRSSGRAPMTDADARSLIASVDTVLVAKGKSILSLTAKEATLDHLRGPTGGFRAPLIRKGKTLLVGFSEEALRSLLK